MRIAYLANIRFPSERAHSAQIAHMCEAFTKAGTTIDLFVSRRTSSDGNGFKRYLGFVPNFSIKNIGPKRIYPKIKPSFFSGELSFVLHFLMVGKLSNYDFLFSRSEYVLWFLSLLGSSSRLVWESHDGRLNFFSKYLMKRNVFVIVTSQAQFKIFSKYTKKILLSPNSIDDSFFDKVHSKISARKNLGLRTDSRYTMYIGGFDRWKGIETFFDAGKYSTSSLHVVIGGGYEEVSKYRKQYPDIIFLGQRPYFELVKNQQAADVLVVPNTSKNKLSREITSPLKLYAHMSSGVPIVMSDIPSLTSVVKSPYVTVCKPDDPEEMARKISDVYSTYGERLSKANDLRISLKDYTWQKRASDIIRFLG